MRRLGRDEILVSSSAATHRERVKISLGLEELGILRENRDDEMLVKHDSGY